MPVTARSTLAALKTESLAIEPAVSLKRIVPLPGCEAGKATRFDLDDAAQMVQHAESEALADLAPGAAFDERVPDEPARLHDARARRPR